MNENIVMAMNRINRECVKGEKDQNEKNEKTVRMNETDREVTEIEKAERSNEPEAAVEEAESVNEPVGKPIEIIIENKIKCSKGEKGRKGDFKPKKRGRMKTVVKCKEGGDIREWIQKSLVLSQPELRTFTNKLSEKFLKSAGDILIDDIPRDFRTPPPGASPSG